MRGRAVTARRGVALALAGGLVAACSSGAASTGTAPGTVATTAAGAPAETTASQVVEATTTAAPTTTLLEAPVEGEEVTWPVRIGMADAGAAQLLVSPALGGVLEASGPDGTGYRFELPPGAVVEPTLITMTPLSAIEGEAVDGLLGGVDFEPSGLQLAIPGVLEIVPVREVAPAARVPFAYEGDGTEIQLAALEPDPSRIALWVGHFSGSGVLESTDLRMRINARLAAQEAARSSTYLQRINDVLLAGHTGEELGAAALARAEAIRQEWIRDHLRPRLDYAERLAHGGNPGDLAYISGVLAEMLAIHRQAVVLGLTGDEHLPPWMWEIATRIDRAVRDALQRRCVEEHDFTVVPILMEIHRSLAILGAGPAQVEADRCGRMELHLSSEIVFRDGSIWPGTVTGRAEAVAPATQLEGGVFAPVPLEWVWEWQADGGPYCTTEVVGQQPGELTAVASFHWNTGTAHDPPRRADGRYAPPDDVVVHYDIGDSRAGFKWDECSQTYGLWRGDHVGTAWTALHEDEATGSRPRWVVRGWEMLYDGPLVARKVYEQRTEVTICEELGFCWPFPQPVVERTTLELVHAPG